METVAEKKIGNKTLKLFYDTDTENPRGEDSCKLGTMLYLKNRSYTLGDKEATEDEMNVIRKHGALEQVNELLEGKRPKRYVYLDVHAYIHGGVSLTTARPGDGNPGYPYTCQWDSLRCGIIYMSYTQVKKTFGDTSPDSIEKAMQAMAAEVKVFCQWLSGQCYGYVLEDENGNETDSCWGYIGDSDEVLEMLAKEVAE